MPTAMSVSADLRAALEEQRAFRIEQLRSLATDGTTRSEIAMPDPQDEVAEALRVAAMTALLEIEAAIVRMEAGTYGACTNCSQHIPPERLEILPMAALCMRCAHARQHRGR